MDLDTAIVDFHQEAMVGLQDRADYFASAGVITLGDIRDDFELREVVSSDRKTVRVEFHSHTWMSPEMEARFWLVVLEEADEAMGRTPSSIERRAAHTDPDGSVGCEFVRIATFATAG